MDNKDKIQDFFIKCFYTILSTAEKSIENISDGELSLKEMRLIDAVYKSAGNNNFSTVAKVLGVTLGTLTTSFARLEKKGYLYKVQDDGDKRIFYIEPTPHGAEMYKQYKSFHEKMFAGITKSITEPQIETMVDALQKLDKFFTSLKLDLSKNHPIGKID
ncbi:MAG: MarR family winged helix-turn-helix transcriptional regulator [Firmicutes bacterium]|nr:MarR family winged helix-turn-helix transcriptional regulator [Bacillota bacterium]